MNLKIILIGFFLFIIPLTYALIDDCNKQCLVEGTSSGTCKTSCDSSETQTGGVASCTAVGSVSLLLGTGAIQSYQNGDPYIDQDANNPNWIWILNNLNGNRATQILNASGESSYSGPLIGIKNTFDATNPTGTPPAITVGGQYCLPGDQLCFKYDSNTISSYASYQITFIIADFSSIFPGWASRSSILITSPDASSGLVTQRANYDLPNITSDVHTSKIWLVYNTSSSIAVFYEDSSGNKQLAGHVLMNSATKSVNIADVDYQQTTSTNVQLNLTGNAGTADNLRILVDILGDVGLPATDGYDDLTISLSHAASGAFDGIGATPGVAESSEITWRSSQLGLKTVNLMTLYGIQILNPSSYGASNTVALEIPNDQLKANIHFIQTYAASENTTTISSTTPAPQLPLDPVGASEIRDLRSFNLILIGGPCANPLVTALFGITCSDWVLQPGQAVIQLARNGEHTALLIAGTTAEDTERAIDVVLHKDAYPFSGSLLQVNPHVEVLNKGDYFLNLSRYPYPFIVNDNYNQLKIVYGEKANIQDSFGAVRIAHDLANMTGRTIFTYTNASVSDSLTSVLQKEIPLGSVIGEDAYFGFSIPATQNFLNRFSGIGYHVHDEIILFGDGPHLETSLSSGDDTYGTNAYLPLRAGALRYYYAFDDPILLTAATPDASVHVQFLDHALILTEVEEHRILTETGQEYILNVGESVNVNGNIITLEGVAIPNVVLDINGEQEILKDGIRQRIQGINIKPIVGFTQNGARCCCFSVFSYFR